MVVEPRSLGHPPEAAAEIIVLAISADGERRINGVIAAAKLPLNRDQTDWGEVGGVLSRA